MESTYFRRGFGLKAEIEGQRAADYHSGLVDSLRAAGNRLVAGHLTFRLAQEFGFCYGVDRAVDYAYETRAKFPDRRLFLVGEIIHNPHVNANLARMGIIFLHRTPAASGATGEFDFSGITADDVVILPAFGVTLHDFERLRAMGCIVVDTTCGSVLNVWKRVESYARDGFTAVIHGKHYHEETRATASQVSRYPQGKFVIVYDMAEARLICDQIEHEGDAARLAGLLGPAASDGFDFTGDLVRIGVANQTTMLSGESLAIAAELRKSLARRYGEEHVVEHFRAFDTICSATQERQDAVVQMLEEPIDVMMVIGGYNSSNTCALAALAQRHGVRTYHIEDAGNIDAAGRSIRHQPVRSKEEITDHDWLQSATVIGITAGASTPNNKIGETVARVCETAGVEPTF
ncbi:MAG TPA: 4-hydroxy-3-methylbut-2-enyl diphosphate reductase [Gemmatimonadales bacterium]|jgi:4-hydroxy-3-methylbut-2-enyl diphosphate reductase